MFALFLLLAFGAARETPPAPPIVVVAPQTEQALADCLARHCGVREDAIASIHQAQNQFASGAYPDARRTLLASIRRNRDATDREPRALSALWHALARVTMHNGDMDEYRVAALRAGSILARSKSVSTAERIRGRVEMADAMAITGDPEGAVRRYRSVADSALARGDIELSQLMELRAIYARSGFDGRPAARRALERAAQDPTLTSRTQTVALSLAAQLQDSDSGKTGALLADLPTQPADAPTMLVWAPEDRDTEQRRAIARALANNDSTLLNILEPSASDARRYGWADIGFWIRPNGRVEQVDVLRSTGNQDWTKDVLNLVRKRRYAPFKAEPGAEGRFKIERVTLTYEHTTPVGSLIRRRSGLPAYRFEELKIEQNGVTRQ